MVSYLHTNGVASYQFVTCTLRLKTISLDYS